MDPQVLAFQFGIGGFVLERNIATVTNEESLRPPKPGGNTMNWIVGHVVRTRKTGRIRSSAGSGRTPTSPNCARRKKP